MEDTSLAAKNQEQALIGKLLQIPFFSKLTGRHINLLLKLAQPMNVDADESLWMEGDPCRGFFLLMQGSLVVVEGGVETHIVDPVVPVGELVLLTGVDYADEVVAIDPSLLLHIPKETFETVLLKSTDLCQRICRNVVSELSEELQRANEHIGEAARRKAQIEGQLKDSDSEVNTLRMLRG